MADQDEDDPQYRSVSGKLKKRFGGRDENGKSFVSIAAGESLSALFGYSHWEGDDKPKSHGLFVLPVIVGLVGGAAGLGTGALYEAVGPGEDPAIQAASIDQFSDGYYAVHGLTSRSYAYALIKQGEHFQLYKQSNSTQNQRLHMVLNRAKAQSAMRAIAAYFEKGAESSLEGAGSGRRSIKILPVSFEEIGTLYFGDSDVYDRPVRNVEGLRFHETLNQQTAENYAKLAKVWSDAADQAQSPAYGLSPEAMEGLSKDLGFMDGAVDGAQLGALAMAALWIFNAGGQAINTARARTGRRRRKTIPEPTKSKSKPAPAPKP